MTTATHLGLLIQQGNDRELADRIVAALNRTRGNLRRAAHQLGVSRRHLYRYLDYASLWGEVEKARTKPRQDPLSKALREL